MDGESKAELIRCLNSSPKYIPTWFRYDLQGSNYFDQMVRDSPTYYLTKSEVAILKTSIQDMLDNVARPCDLVDMGSGNSFKTRMFIDAMLERQSVLNYIPVDISAEFLQEISKSIANEYGSKLNVHPVPGEYNVGINKLRDLKGNNRLILWLGSFINVTEGEQVSLLKKMADIMKSKDRLLISLDLTTDKEVIEKAYLDDEGKSDTLFLNSVWRINRDFGANIDTDQFVLEDEFLKSTDNNMPSRLMARIVAKSDLTYDIPGLDMTLSLKKGECVNLFDNDGGSFKYTLDQVRTLASKGNLHLDRYWIGPDQHAAFCCFRKLDD